jgi:hypothetical protein
MKDEILRQKFRDRGWRIVPRFSQLAQRMHRLPPETGLVNQTDSVWPPITTGATEPPIWISVKTGFEKEVGVTES